MKYSLILLDRDGTLNYEAQNHHRDLSVLRPYPFSGPALRGLTDAEAAAILTHEEDVNFGQDTFAWDNVQKSIVYLVAFDESVLPLKLTPDGRNDQWRCDVGSVPSTHVEITPGDRCFGTHGTGVYSLAPRPLIPTANH